MNIKIQIENNLFHFSDDEIKIHKVLIRRVIDNDWSWAIVPCDLDDNTFRDNKGLNDRYVIWREKELKEYKNLYIEAYEKYKKLIVIS